MVVFQRLLRAIESTPQLERRVRKINRTHGQESVLRPLRSKGAIGRIIIVACEVAADSDGNGRLGKAFCTRIAEESGAFVLAADALQSVDFWYQVFSHPFGTIDDFEGTVYEFSPAGGHEVWIGNTAD